MDLLNLCSLSFIIVSSEKIEENRNASGMDIIELWVGGYILEPGPAVLSDILDDADQGGKNISDIKVPFELMLLFKFIC